MFGLGPAMTGGLAGLLFGIVSFVTLQTVGSAIERQNKLQSATTGKVLKMVGLVELFLFPALGYYLGPIVLGG